MKWFQGSIADAVNASKSSNAVFVVYIEGSDELSKTMSTVMDSGIISNELATSKFVCIKLSKDSESHKQFTEIYKIVPVPSLFFIGENGVPLEIIPGDNSADNLKSKITSALSKIKGSPITEEAVANKETSPSGSSDTIKPPVNTSNSQSNTSSASSTSVQNELKNQSVSDKDKSAELEKVEELIKKKREENQKLEEQKEKERELARRRMGKEISEAKKHQQDKELDQMRKDREKERKLEAEARQRVLRQIEEDKANRAAKQAATQASETDASNSSLPDKQTHQQNNTFPPCQANEGRIQFKLPDGQTRTQTFPASTTLRDLRAFIDNNINVPFNEYTLATTFPRREYSSRDLGRDLSDLQLLPSSVVLILPIKGSTAVMKGPGWTTAISALFWGLVQPILDIGSYLRSLITGRRDDSAVSSSQPSSSQTQPEAHPDQQQPTRPPYYQSLGGTRSVRKRGNVHTLSDGNDSNDENNTWNGNSTQLM